MGQQESSVRGAQEAWGEEAQLTQAQTELMGGEEAGSGLVQALKYGLQLLRCQAQIALQALARWRAG